MPETQLKTKNPATPPLFQREVFSEEVDLGEPVKRRRVRRPVCDRCAVIGLATELIAYDAETWACGRGHGPLG